MFLTDEDVFRLTGRRRATAQARWLRARRIRHFVNAAGRVIIAHSWLADIAPEAAPADPDFLALEKA